MSKPPSKSTSKSSFPLPPPVCPTCKCPKLIQKNCNDQIFRKLINYFAAPLIAILTFLFLIWGPIDSWFQKNISDFYYRITAKVLIMFTVVYITDRILVRWRLNNPVCSDPFHS